ncbi:MAG: 5-oxoprolinase subunit PxpA [Thalassotalea sp.]
MKLNCDLGESYGAWQKGNDALAMPFIDMANIACGFHAGDPLIMSQTVALAKLHQVDIGAHPSYPDLQGFGRRSIKFARDELIAIIQYQLGALSAICHVQNVTMNYVKPHGALYNDMMANLDIFDAVCQAIAPLNKTNIKCQAPSLNLVVQALPDNSQHQKIAKKHQLNLLFEAFADRNYQDNGLLVPRSNVNAVIEDTTEIVTKCQHLLATGHILSITGKALAIHVDTLCVHGDNQAAITIVKALNSLLKTT